MDMKLSKKKISLLNRVESCGGWIDECQLFNSEYPISLIDSLISIGLLVRIGDVLYSSRYLDAKTQLQHGAD